MVQGGNMLQKKGLKIITGFITALIFISLLAYANTDVPGGYRSLNMTFETARVLEVLEDNTVINPDFPETIIGQRLILIEVLTGEHAGTISEIRNHFYPAFQVDVSEGSRISIIIRDLEHLPIEILLHNQERSRILIGSVVLFLLALGIIGGKKGIKSIIGLIFTLVSILFLLVPLFLKGYAPIPTTVLILALTAIVSLVLLSGWTKKTAVAVIGCISGVVFAAILATTVGHIAGINGFNLEQTDQLFAVGLDTNLHIGGLFISGTLIASLGAVMDISMTIASAAEELTVSNKKMTTKQLFKSAMNIGRDAMGTMSSTLILAFVGTGLSMIVVIFGFGSSFAQVINMDFIAVEIIRSLAGSLGLVVTVPIVSYTASRWMTK